MTITIMASGSQYGSIFKNSTDEGMDLRNYAWIRIGNRIITSKPAIKYLGVMIDGKLNFKQHTEHTCEKSSTISMALARMIPNVAGPRHTCRLLIARVVSFIMLYAVPVWGNALQVNE